MCEQDLPARSDCGHAGTAAPLWVRSGAKMSYGGQGFEADIDWRNVKLDEKQLEIVTAQVERSQSCRYCWGSSIGRDGKWCHCVRDLQKS